MNLGLRKYKLAHPPDTSFTARLTQEGSVADRLGTRGTLRARGCIGEGCERHVDVVTIWHDWLACCGLLADPRQQNVLGQCKKPKYTQIYHTRSACGDVPPCVPLDLNEVFWPDVDCDGEKTARAVSEVPFVVPEKKSSKIMNPVPQDSR